MLNNFKIKKFQPKAGQPQAEKIKNLGIIFLIILFLVFPLNTAKAQADSNKSDIDVKAVFSLTNSSRVKNGLNPLSIDSKLVKAAQSKGADMIKKDYFAHTSPEGLNSWFWFKKVNYNYKVAGENLAIDFSDTNTVFDAWMKSPSHRANILDPDFNEIGIAVIEGDFEGEKTAVVVQMFGTESGVQNEVSSQNNPTVIVENYSNSRDSYFSHIFTEIRLIFNEMTQKVQKIFAYKVLLASSW